MRTRTLTTILAAFWGLSLVPLAAAETGTSTPPNAVEGLLAWYDARTLYDKLRNRERVERWPDASGNGHDLTEEGKGVGTVFRTVEADDRPTVQVGEHSSFAVADPFPLEDHTIFIVHRAGGATLGLFSAARNAQLGVVLAKDGKQHVIHAGPRDASYGTVDTAPGATTDYSITVLAREGGKLNAWADGRGLSGGDSDGTPLEVGRLFHVALSRAVSRDAAGLRLAELIVYGRRLTDAEREGITAHLAEKYKLALQAPPTVEEPQAFDWSRADPQARLATSSKTNLNVPGLAITWDAPLHLAEPFRFDAEQPTRLYCDRDARVHLSLRLALTSTAPGARLRILVLRNTDDYRVDDEVATQPAPDDASGARLAARLDLSLALSKGDWVEVVVARDGADGEVTPLAGESLILAVAE